MKKPWNLLVYFLFGALGIWLCAVLVLPVGLPFLLGFLISCFARPLRPRKWKSAYSGIFSVSLVFLMLCLLLWILGKSLFSEGQALAKQLPKLLQELSPVMTRLEDRLLHFSARLPEPLSQATADWIGKLFAGSSVLLTTASERLFSLAAGILTKVPDLLLFVLTSLLSAYFFSIDGDSLRSWFRSNLPRHWREKACPILRKLRHALGGYVRSQLYLSAVSFAICALGLLILGYRKFLLLALLVGLVDALPVLGSGAVLLPWALLCFLRGDTAAGSGLLLLYAVVSIVRTVLEPKFLGKQIGLHPLLTLLSLYGGYKLFRIAGMILLPIGVLLFKQLYELSREF